MAMNWYPERPKKETKCLVCNGSGKVIDKVTHKLRDCVLCVNKKTK